MTEKEISANGGGMVVGAVLFGLIIWSVFHKQMHFAQLNVVLLTALALFNHFINRKYR
jgi:hypothetical protein